MPGMNHGYNNAQTLALVEATCAMCGYRATILSGPNLTPVPNPESKEAFAVRYWEEQHDLMVANHEAEAAARTARANHKRLK